MLRIDPDFHAYVPALSDDERAQLESGSLTRDQRMLIIGRRYNEAQKNASLAAAKLVYFLGAGPFVKIGQARMSPQRRIKQLQTGCPYPIELLAWLPGGRERERALHRRFSQWRAQSEWFHATEEILAYVADIKAGREQ